MKKIHKKLLSLTCAFGIFTTVFSHAAGYLGSDVTAKAADTITISTADELLSIGKDAAYPLNGDYVLDADIDLTDENFVPIGGGVGTRGADSGDNVFSGSFDGGNHVISNLTMDVQKSPSSGTEAWQYGLFGIISSTDSSDPAVVKNLILTGVNISVDMQATSNSNYLSLGALAGEVNHNALIDNVAVLNGKVEGNPSNAGDVVGVGGLIGEMRYSTQTQGGPPGQQTTAVNGVTISNVYVGADVVSGSSTDSRYAAGIVGRIAKSNPTSMTACVYTGNTSFKSESGYGISGGDMTENISDCYYIYGSANTGIAVSEDDLKADTLLAGLSDSYWTVHTGSYMMLKQCMESEIVADILALANLSLGLAEGDSLSAVTSDFTVPTSIVIGETTEAITWTCDSDVLTIDKDGNVTVSQVYADTDCTLTATTESKKTKTFKLTVLTKIAVRIEQEYATIGEPLTAAMINAPEDMICTYVWSVDGVEKTRENYYTPASDDLEKMLTLTATASGEYNASYSTSMYISKLPVVYVNTEGGAEIVSKEDYLNGYLKIQGNAEYNQANETTLYDGIMEIRGRGNTTWGYEKKPYKIKLDTKTDIFGFGANKHWVLLANYTDESHMRNKLAYDLSGEMGMPYMQSVHVDLILNGEYKGTYQFCEQVKISKARVDIHDWEDYAEDVAKAIYKVEKDNSGMTKNDRDAIETILAETDMSWMTTKEVTYQGTTYKIDEYINDMPAATGGFLMELDAYYDEVSKFTSGKSQPLMFKSPEFVYTSTDTMNYVENYINAFEKAIDASDFTTTYQDETVSYSQLFDMDSLVQFWLVQELFFNVDAMKKSTYMYKDVDGKFFMGPIWDMDWSSNSLVSQYQDSGVYNTWQTTKFADGAQKTQWYKSIVKDPYFAVKAYELYTDMREDMGSIVADNGKIDTWQKEIAESADANAALWYGGNSQKKFDTQTAALKEYLTNRLGWLDSQFTSPAALAKSLGYTSAGGITVKADDMVTKTSGAMVITANVTNSSVKSVEYLVNGIKTGVAEVADGKASIEVPAEALVTTGTSNTVQVFGLNASGTVITSGGSKVTDFAAFQTGIHPEDGKDDGKEDGGNTSDDGKEDGGNTSDDGKEDSGNTSEDGKNDGTNTPNDGKNDGKNDGENTAGGSSTNDTSTQTPEGDTSSEIQKPEVKLNVTSAPMQKKQKTTAIKIVSKYPADDTVVSWESSNSDIVSVNKKGTITAKKTGTAVVTVTMKSGAKASCTIKVQKGMVKTRKLSAEQKTITIKKGKAFQIALKRTPVTANDKISYSISKKIVKISANGKGKALKKGTTKVIVKAGSRKVQLTIKVK